MKEFFFRKLVGWLHLATSLQINFFKVIRRCSAKEKMFLKTLQNSQKNFFAEDSFLINLQAENLKLSEAATGDVL